MRRPDGGSVSLAMTAPLDVLHAKGAAPLLAMTQMLESLSRAEPGNADDANLQQISNVAAIVLLGGAERFKWGR
ncbi:short-chain dehydrogenase [Pseudomonas protegens]|uniref:short-chain dehydrogenase n=2 Tax=Pseudomonas protegens TaxID=380021 RepID=UPI00384A7C81